MADPSDQRAAWSGGVEPEPQSARTDGQGKPAHQHAEIKGGHGEGEHEPWRRDRYGSLYDQDRMNYGSGFDSQGGEYGGGEEVSARKPDSEDDDRP